MRTLLRQILDHASRSEESDADLLRRFADLRDGEAFGQLVRRYGGLVWGQCRNLVANEADADDAFQATFLVLAKSARTIRTADRLGPWLHGVAYRVCQNARRETARRARREQAAAAPEASRPVADSAWDALLAAVYEELHALPEKLRTAFVLCYLEGKGTTEAAQQLGLKLGTFSARLTRAREQLLARLAARGLAVGVGVLVALGGTAVQAAPALVQRAVAVALAQTVPAVLLTLTNGVLMMMGVTKLKVAALLLVGALACGGLWSLQAQPPGGGASGSGAFPPGGQPDLPRVERELRDLREQVALREQELRRLEKEAAAKTSEYRYVAQQPGYAPTPAEFEKAVKEVEKEGYRFVGVVTMALDVKRPAAGAGGLPGAGLGTGGGPPGLGAVPTLVFRKTVPLGGGVAPRGSGGIGGAGTGSGFGGASGGPGANPPE